MSAKRESSKPQAPSSKGKKTSRAKVAKDAKAKPATQQELKRRKIADRIAQHLFTRGDNVEAIQLALITQRPLVHTGWAKTAVADVIERELSKWLLAKAAKR